HDRVAVLHRAAKEGLGPAYLAGFRRALADGADLVLEIDCDFSHDPDDVPRLIAAAAEADLVLGSRYVQGGRVENWGAGRRFVSRAGALYPQVLLPPSAPAPAASSATAGRCWSASTWTPCPPAATRSRSRPRTGPFAPGSASSR